MVKLDRVAEVVGPAFHGAVHDSFETVVKNFIRLNGLTKKLPDRVFATNVTELAKIQLLNIPGVARVGGRSGEFTLQLDDETLRFRINRSRAGGAKRPKDATADDLLSPTGNAVSEHSGKGLFHVLWVADQHQFGGVWIVKPAVPLEAHDGTQFATYQKVNGRWWSRAIKVQRQAVDVDQLAAPQIDRKVVLDQRNATGEAAAQAEG